MFPCNSSSAGENYFLFLSKCFAFFHEHLHLLVNNSNIGPDRFVIDEVKSVNETLEMKVMNESTWSHTRTIHISFIDEAHKLIDEARNREHRLIYNWLVKSKILFYHLSPSPPSPWYTHWQNYILYLVASFKAITKLICSSTFIIFVNKHLDNFKRNVKYSNEALANVLG